MESQMEPSIFEDIAVEMKTEITSVLKNILTINGYDNSINLKMITHEDITKIETFMKKQLHTLIPNQERAKYYGPLYEHFPEKFLFNEGQKKLIFLIKDHLTKKSGGVDKSVMTDPISELFTNNTENIAQFSSQSPVEKPEGIVLQSNSMTQQNSFLFKMLKQWAKTKIDEVAWIALDLEDKFNNIKFETTEVADTENSLRKNALICKITCFCQKQITVSKLGNSKKNKSCDPGKARWVCSNYHTHFLKKHSSKTKMEETPSEKPVYKTKKTTGQPKSPRKITSFLTFTHPNPKTNESELGSESLKKTDPKIKILQSIKLNKNVLFNSSTIQETHNNSCSKPNLIDSSQSDFESGISKVSSDENQDQDLKDYQESGVDIEVKDCNDQNRVEVFQEDQESEDIRNGHMMVSASVSADPSPIDQELDTDGSFANKENKWSSLKYSRSERLRRKRESFHIYQPLITNFVTLIQNISTIIEEDADHSKDFTEAAVNFSLVQKNQTDSNKINVFLNQLSKIANTNKGPVHANSYDEDLKKFALYIFYVGGKLLYETLQNNLKNILPSITTLQRFRSRQNFIKEEGVLNFEGLSAFLEQHGLPKVVWISEDATRITGKIEYNSSTNKVMGFVAPLLEGLPKKDIFLARNAKEIESYFLNFNRANYAYVIMAQPVNPDAPAFCISLFATDNRFTYKDVLERWDKIVSEASKFEIKILGFSSDGDTRLLKAMKLKSAFISNKNLTLLEDWCHIDFSQNDLCFLQDSIHILTKLKTRLLKPRIYLPLGNYLASSEHLEQLIASVNKSHHLLTKMDISPEDKMNYKSAEKMCHYKVREYLEENVTQSNGTVIYLKVMQYIIDSLIASNEDLATRLFKVWYAVFFLRYWRKWIKDHKKYTLTENFISLNSYTCVEINGHMLIKLIKRFQTDDSITEDMFWPSIFNSQSCESLFRTARSMTSTQSTVVNFSIKDLFNRIDRIGHINYIVRDLKGTFVFAREQKKKDFSKTLKKDIDEISITDVINRSLEEAFMDASNLGMTVEKNDAFNLLLNVEEKLEETREENCDVHTNDNENLEKHFFDDNGANEATNQASTGIERKVLSNDLELVQDENLLEDNIDLRDYSDQKIDISEGSPYLRVTLPNNKVRVIKKSSFIWLLDDGNGRVSTDRLKRFLSNKKRKNDIEDVRPSTSRSSKKLKKSKGMKENQNKKRKNSDSDTDLSSDEDVIFMESDDSPYFEEGETPSEDIKAIKSIGQIKKGDFVLVSFVGGKRNAQKFNYICIVQDIIEDDVKVMALNTADSTKKTYIANEKDVSFVKFSQIIGLLNTPDIVPTGERVRYVFRSSIGDVSEM